MPHLCVLISGLLVTNSQESHTYRYDPSVAVLATETIKFIACILWYCGRYVHFILRKTSVGVPAFTDTNFCIVKIQHILLYGPWFYEIEYSERFSDYNVPAKISVKFSKYPKLKNFTKNGATSVMLRYLWLNVKTSRYALDTKRSFRHHDTVPLKVMIVILWYWCYYLRFSFRNNCSALFDQTWKNIKCELSYDELGRLAKQNINISSLIVSFQWYGCILFLQVYTATIIICPT